MGFYDHKIPNGINTRFTKGHLILYTDSSGLPCQTVTGFNSRLFKKYDSFVLPGRELTVVWQLALEEQPTAELVV